MGLKQGGPELPALFNVVADPLMRITGNALYPHLTSADPLPAKAFADDLLLQCRRLLDAKRALAACELWALETGQKFTVAKDKSAYLRRPGEATDLGLTVNDRCRQAYPTCGCHPKSVISSTSSTPKLGVTLTATGPTDMSAELEPLRRQWPICGQQMPSSEAWTCLLGSSTAQSIFPTRL